MVPETEIKVYIRPEMLIYHKAESKSNTRPYIFKQRNICSVV